MKTLSIDLETYSKLDLASVGLYRYSENCHIMLFGYAYDDEKPKTIDMEAGKKLPQSLIDDLTDPAVLKTAFNAAFEMNVINRCLGIEIYPEQWSCTMVLCCAFGLPASLAGAGKALGLPEDKQKDKKGKALIKLFCTGHKTQSHLLDMGKSLWDAFKDYNVQDVVTEREIRKRLHLAFRDRLYPQTHEQEIWALDWAINRRGVCIDQSLVTAAIQYDARLRKSIEGKATVLMHGENVNSVPALRKYLIQRGLLDTTSSASTAKGQIKLDKDARAQIMTRLQNDLQEGDLTAMERRHREDALQILQYKNILAKSSVKKYQAMQKALCKDGRVHGMLQYYGAARTGRWAGRMVQVHNLPQNHLNGYPEELNDARWLLCNDTDMLDINYAGQQSDVLSQLVRTAFIPKAGCRFVVADFSAIEARVLAWLAGEQWVVDAFSRGEDIYCETASRMFRVPVVKHGVNGELRQKGKITLLACGYGGGVGALKAFGADRMGMSEEEMQNTIDAWRDSNSKIRSYWYEAENAAKSAIALGQRQQGVGDINAVELDRKTKLHFGFGTSYMRFRYESGCLQIALPSQRCLIYRNPTVDVCGRLSYQGATDMGAWGSVKTFGGKIVENITQAVARDCLAEAMLRLDTAGYKIVMHVHDEVICEMPKEQGSVQDMVQIMCQPPAWAEGLPLNADGFEASYYKKD